MPGITTTSNNSPTIHRSPTDGASRSRTFGTRLERHYGALAGDNGETDFYLTRSYEIVDRLRRAVADRDELIRM